MTKRDLIKQLKMLLRVHKQLMLEFHGRPDCKNCASAESIQGLLDKEEQSNAS